jgi:hypothetical protein
MKAAEGEGFEPPDRRNRSTAFKAAAFSHSATPPGIWTVRVVLESRPWLGEVAEWLKALAC